MLVSNDGENNKIRPSNSPAASKQAGKDYGAFIQCAILSRKVA